MSSKGSGPPRDLIGYGGRPVDPKWPHQAKIAVSFVLNYEEGGENNIMDGDATSEHLLSEIVGAQPCVGERHLNMETIYEYGSRAGFWRLRRLFTKHATPVTVFAVGLALEKNPTAAEAMLDAGWEIASHGYRWIDYQNVPEQTERQHIHLAVEAQLKATKGKSRPIGFYQGKPNVHTRQYLIEEGGFLYDNDAYNDDLPYWDLNYAKPHLIIPYTLCNNDMRFVSPQGFNCGEQFFTFLKDAFDVLLKEGQEGTPKMMTIGLHCRIVGQPGRTKGLERFLKYIEQYGEEVWVCTRRDICSHWYKYHHPNDRTKANL